MQFELTKFLKAPAAQQQIDTISLKELVKLTGATGFKPMNETAKASARVHIMKGDQRLFAIRVGKSVRLANNLTSAEGMKELFGNYIIYYGESENGTWVAFGKKGELTEGITYSLEQLKDVVGVL